MLLWSIRDEGRRCGTVWFDGHPLRHPPGPPVSVRRRPQRDRRRRSSGGGPLAQQQGGKFTPPLPTTRAGDAQVPEDENTPEIRLGPWNSSQPFSAGAPPRQPPNLQRETLRRPDRVARCHGIKPDWVWVSCALTETSSRWTDSTQTTVGFLDRIRRFAGCPRSALLSVP